MTPEQQKLFKIGCEKCGKELFYFETEYEVFDKCPACDEGELLPVDTRVAYKALKPLSEMSDNIDRPEKHNVGGSMNRPSPNQEYAHRKEEK